MTVMNLLGSLEIMLELFPGKTTPNSPSQADVDTPALLTGSSS